LHRFYFHARFGEGKMKKFFVQRRGPWLLGAIIAVAQLAGATDATAPAIKDLNAAAISIKLPEQLKWQDLENGAKMAILTGDPAKPGYYAVLYKWPPHKMSHPHFHPHDRFVTVISGTWWVGTGTKFDPDHTVPLPPGSFAQHFAKQVHYDGAKDTECILEIAGEGPGTSIPAEVK
jgi:hypothetical protein